MRGQGDVKLGSQIQSERGGSGRSKYYRDLSPCRLLNQFITDSGGKDYQGSFVQLTAQENLTDGFIKGIMAADVFGR